MGLLAVGGRGTDFLTLSWLALTLGVSQGQGGMFPGFWPLLQRDENKAHTD